ncbi:MAG: hypothetical protein RML56_07855 [Burkholderiales bacterium]|nr:hypothetical protein [Burkholderiales bacterium]
MRGRRLRQAERIAQRGKARLLRAPFARALRKRKARVLFRHLDPHAALALERAHHRRAGSGELHWRADDDERWRRLRCVMLLQERRQHFARPGAFGVARKEASVADAASAADHHEIDARDPVFARARDDVGVDAPVGLDVLARLHPRESARPVAEHRRLLVAHRGGRGLHLFHEHAAHVVLASLEEHFGRLHVLPIARLVDQPGARRAAAPNLVEQAGARAVLEDRVLARAQAEHTLQQLDALAHRLRMRERSEVPVCRQKEGREAEASRR